MTISIRNTLMAVAAVAGLTVIAAPASAEGGHHLRDGGFSFEGPFGTFDQGQLQRGYKVYREVCSACHSMSLMHFRTLGEKGGPFYDPHAANPAENRYVKALAAEVQVADIDNETGEPIMRPGIAADAFPLALSEPHGGRGGQRRGGSARPVGDGQGPPRRRRLHLFDPDRLSHAAGGSEDDQHPALQRLYVG
jgi:ubiquinol-cytochrome c reductase cytochrome c1 subunit